MNVWTKWLLSSAFVFVAAGAHAQDVHGVLRVVKGDVQVKSGKDGSLSKARIGSQVYPKDIIITGKDARAKIVMVDNNEINVSPDSQIEIQHYEFDPNAGKKDVLLNVIYGKVRSKVEQKYDGKSAKFEIKTPSAVAGVRGTDFLASYDRGNSSSSVVTFQGKVEFGNIGAGGKITNAVFVTPGKTASSVAGAAPSAPTAMPKSELAKMDHESKADTGGAGPKADGGGDRQPSGDKKDSSKDKGASNDSSNGGRAPASAGGSTLKDGDMASNDNHPPSVILQSLAAGPQGPQVFGPPPPPVPPPCGIICDKALQQKTTVKITIHQ
jgi:hypothetical protein